MPTDRAARLLGPLSAGRPAARARRDTTRSTSSARSDPAPERVTPERATRPAPRSFTPAPAAPLAPDVTPASTSAPAWPRSPILSTTLELSARLVGGASSLSQRLPEPARSLAHRGLQRVRRLPWPVRPLRVALALGEREAAALAAAHADARRERAFDISWFLVSPERAARALHADALDAVVTLDAIDRRGRVLRVQTLERPGRDAGWHDWGLRTPLSYLSLFPVRLDCARATLEGVDFSEPASVRVVAGLVELAAALSRSPARLGADDRLRGRAPIAPGVGAGATHAGRGLSPLRVNADPVLAAVRALADALRQCAPSPRATGVERAAARVVSAHFASCADADDRERLDAAELCARVLADEPEVALRLLAARANAGDDDGALDAAREALGAVTDAPQMRLDDLPALLHAELDRAPAGALTTGRVAAGLCLLSAEMPPDRIAFLRADLADDARYCEWLVGRDQERALLLRVLRELEMTARAQRLPDLSRVQGSTTPLARAA